MKIGIITGASSGMGKEFVIALDKEGLDELWLIARRKELLEALAKELNTKCKVIPMDITDSGNIQTLREELAGHEVMWLVNSAGVGKSGNFESLAVEDISSLIDLNIKALTLMTAMCLPYCGVNSRIVNLASSAAFLPQPNFAIYAASKRYVLNFSRALAEEVKSKKISVTAVCPGPVKTEFLSLSGMPKYKEKFAVDPKAVVNQAMKDIKKGKRISVYSLPMKVVHVISKLLPTDLILKFYQ